MGDALRTLFNGDNGSGSVSLQSDFKSEGGVVDGVYALGSWGVVGDGVVVEEKEGLRTLGAVRGVVENREDFSVFSSFV